jgi:hypothetical protein
MKILLCLLLGFSVPVFAKTTVDCNEDSVDVTISEGLNLVKSKKVICSWGKADLYYFRGCTNKNSFTVKQFKNDTGLFFTMESGSNISEKERKPIKSLKDKLFDVALSTCVVKDDKSIFMLSGK